jgi:hypothetical protein
MYGFPHSCRLISIFFAYVETERGENFFLATAIAQIVTAIIAVATAKSVAPLNSGTVGLGDTVAVVPADAVGLEESENIDSPVEVASTISPLPEL